MSSSILQIGGGKGGKQQQGKQQQQQKKEPEVFASARMKIQWSAGDINKIKDALKELWGKVNCPAGKTKPNINLNLPNDGPGATKNAHRQIQELKTACGFQNTGSTGSPGSPSEPRALDITLVDFSKFQGRFTMLFRSITERLDKLNTDITRFGIGGKLLKNLIPFYTPVEMKEERGRNFTTRFLDLKTKIGNLNSEVNQILDFAQKGSIKDGSPYLNEYYRSLLAVQSELTGSVSTDTRSKEYPGAKESSERIKSHAKDVLSLLTTLELDVGMIDGSEKKEETGKDVSFSVNFITNTDLRNAPDINIYLTSTKPYYYFDMETPPRYNVGDKITIIETGKKGTIENVIQPTDPDESNPEGTLPMYEIHLEDNTDMTVDEYEIELQDPTLLTDGFSKNEVYRKIQAVNGFACLDIIEHHKDMMEVFDSLHLTEDKFTFTNDVCNYLFQLPEETFSYKEAIQKEDFKNQIPVLAIIHQLHFIGMLMKYQEIDASVTTSELLDTASVEEAQNRLDEANSELKGVTDKIELNKTDLMTLESEIRGHTFPKTLTSNEQAFDNQIKDVEKRLNVVREELKKKKNEKTAEQAKLDAFDSSFNISNESSRRTKLSERGDIQNKIRDLDDEIEDLEENEEKVIATFDNIIDFYLGLVTTFSSDLTQFPLTAATTTIALFKKYDFCKQTETELTKQKEEINAKIKAAEEHLATVKASHNEKEKQLENTSAQFIVPDFRGDLVAKYKYAMNFTLNEEDVPINIDEIIKNIYRSLRDSTFGVQSLQKIKIYLENPQFLAPPGVPEEIAATLPGTPAVSSQSNARAEKEKLRELFAKDVSADDMRLQTTIQMLGMDFVEAYGPSVKQSFLDSRPAAKKNNPFSYSDMDQMVQITKKGLPTSPTITMPKYTWEKAQQQYEKIKSLMGEYERKRDEIKTP